MRIEYNGQRLRIPGCDLLDCPIDQFARYHFFICFHFSNNVAYFLALKLDFRAMKAGMIGETEYLAACNLLTVNVNECPSSTSSPPLPSPKQLPLTPTSFWGVVIAFVFGFTIARYFPISSASKGQDQANLSPAAAALADVLSKKKR